MYPLTKQRNKRYRVGQHLMPDVVYSVVKDEGQNTISTRWVYSLKSTPNGIMQKAQLVVRGFEEDWLK